MKKITGQLNPGIKKTVELFQKHGFNTCDSGDGKTHDYSCDREYAYVSIICKEEQNLISECSRLQNLLYTHGIKITPVGQVLHEDNKTTTGVAIHASYDAADCLGIIDVIGICDGMLLKSE